MHTVAWAHDERSEIILSTAKLQVPQVPSWSRAGHDAAGHHTSNAACWLPARTCQGAGRSGGEAAVGGAQGGLGHHGGAVGRAALPRGDGGDLLRVHAGHGRVRGRHRQRGARGVGAAAELDARGVVARRDLGDGVPAMQGARVGVRLVSHWRSEQPEGPENINMAHSYAGCDNLPAKNWASAELWLCHSEDYAALCISASASTQGPAAEYNTGQPAACSLRMLLACPYGRAVAAHEAMRGGPPSLGVSRTSRGACPAEPVCQLAPHAGSSLVQPLWPCSHGRMVVACQCAPSRIDQATNICDHGKLKVSMGQVWTDTRDKPVGFQAASRGIKTIRRVSAPFLGPPLPSRPSCLLPAFRSRVLLRGSTMQALSPQLSLAFLSLAGGEAVGSADSQCKRGLADCHENHVWSLAF